MRVYQKSLARGILLILEKSVDGCVRLEDFANNPGFYAYYDGWQRQLKKSSIAKALERLRKGGLIEKSLDNNNIIFKLTDTGRDIIGDEPEEKDWDKKWRIVIFDIPEEKRIIRNLFRRNLKKWGFKHLQKSVWISKRNVYDKLEAYIKDLGVEEWVIVMEVNRLSI